MSTRGSWSFKPPNNWRDEEIEVTCGHQGVTISVSEENAQGSYNVLETCNIVLDDKTAFALGLFLIRQTSAPVTKPSE